MSWALWPILAVGSIIGVAIMEGAASTGSAVWAYFVAFVYVATMVLLLMRVASW